ncbi:MAG: bifunctional glutamate N-acetyltransferase/amino-acid acetyltransferase ArgJ [Oscillospiraceae bacterium]|nr:bifunctional glutamate N-acetyltransferase/amino-acid acetyltransferase ArgJ [Oscillospiraceae bacterium]
MKLISGGVTAAKGFRAAGVHAGVKAGSSPDKNDLAMILCDTEAAAAGVYTMNRVKAAPIYVTMEHLENGTARGVIANSGNANACAPLGHENAVKMCEAAASATGLRPEDFIVCSTGVIGQTLNVSVIEDACPTLASLLSRDGSGDAAAAIMTTDTKKKEIAVSFEIGGKEVRLGGIAKGSGMIHPNMGTMLCFLTTDCAISSDVLQDALYEVTKVTFNRVSVDGDTSTNDTCCILASGAAENALIDWKSEDYDVFYGALKYVCTELAKKIAGDGEGATKLVSCTVSGSRSDEAAEKLSMEVIRSSLVKAAMFGADANWGRVLCAMGYSKAPFRPECVDVAFASAAGTIQVCKAGEGLDFDEELAKKVLSQPEVEILVNVNEGEHAVTAWGCDLTYDYVKINGDYRT